MALCLQHLKCFITGETGKWKDFRDDVRIRYSDGIMLTLITAQNNKRIMEVKTKEDWLYQFRRCSSRETLEKVISHTRYKLTPAEMEAFNAAVDHRLAELTMNKLYDRVPASVWKYVT